MITNPSGRVRAVLAAVVAGIIGVFAMATPAHAGPIEDAKVAIAEGDGAEAAKIIAAHGYADQPEVLADIIYGAGVLAVAADNGDAYSIAVADAFVKGGVTFGTANTAFRHAATLVITNAPHDDQLLAELGPGGAAIVRTELAYFNVYLPSLPAT
ncbi:hypothetical protein ACIA03_07435 [Nocardioides sp. NPDC051685]|uniref:hypothetical protein n=1 Tax=Nocardioides sp. NPDC051685 TaxID=3364334 RepID=UPI0037BDC0AF